jgi:hypothetical protein
MRVCCRTLVCLFFVLATIAGYSQQTACKVQPPKFHPDKPNIFSEEQEQWLGDAQAAQLEPDYMLLPEKDTAEITRIGQNLLSQLPSTSIKYVFRVYNADEVNAFSIAGGHVYISRKLITDAHNEDEVAAVLAHEIGHIYSRAMTIGVTRSLKALLNVTSLGDRRDVEDKQQLLINAPWKAAGRESADEREASEIEADSIALYAMTRAGYAPASLAENLDRITDSKGHASLFLKVLSGENTDIALRLHSAHKVVDALPADCRLTKPASSSSFAEFQQRLRTESPRWLVEPTPGLVSFALDPPMRPSFDWIRFSPDGATILAQDESRIHVLSRAPLKLLFSIDAEGAERARFSPDSKRISFEYADRRVESWDVPAQKRVSMHDLVDYRGCIVSGLAPDGRTYACLKYENQGVGLSLLDVESEKVFYEDKKLNEYPGWGNHAKIVFSPDARTMLAIVGGRSFAYDLSERKQIPLHGNLSSLIAARVAFVGSNKLAFECGAGQAQKDGAMLYTMCLDSFPAGDKLGKFPIGDQWVRDITQGDQVLMGPAGQNAAVLVDPASGTIQRAFRVPEVDLYGQTLVTETAKGSIALKEAGATGIETVDLPISPLSSLAAGDFSSDGRYLAYSHESRGSVWDLGQHKQVSLLHPFSSMRFDAQDRLQLHLVESFGQPGANITLDPAKGSQTAGASFEKEQQLMSGVLVYFKPLDKGFNGVVRNVEMQVSDAASGKLLWTRHFPNGRPRLYESDGNSLILTYSLRTDEAAGENSAHKDKFVKSSDSMKEWIADGLVIEFLDAQTGDVERILQTPTRSAWGNDDRSVAVYGNYVAVHGNLNNTTVYRLSDGVRTSAFYGRVLSGDGARGLLAVTNREQEIIVYDVANGNEIKRMTLDHVPRAARFVSSGNALLVLTATQHVVTIPLSGLAPAESASAK